MKYFKKITLDINAKLFANVEKVLLHEYTTLPKRLNKDFDVNTFIYAQQYTIPKDLQDLAILTLPKQLLEKEIPSIHIMKLDAKKDLDSVLPKHIDFRRQCIINFYLTCSDEVTMFFEKENLDKPVETFTANKNECWLLNGSEIHSVSVKKGNTREFLTFSFKNLSFDDVANHF